MDEESLEVKTLDGITEWRYNGMLHNWFGPAVSVKDPDGYCPIGDYKQYWIYGDRVTKEQHERRKKEMLKNIK